MVVLTEQGHLKQLCDLPFSGLEDEVGYHSNKPCDFIVAMVTARAGDGAESSQYGSGHTSVLRPLVLPSHQSRDIPEGCVCGCGYSGCGLAILLCVLTAAQFKYEQGFRLGTESPGVDSIQRQVTQMSRVHSYMVT